MQKHLTEPALFISLISCTGVFIPSRSFLASEPIEGIARFDIKSANVKFLLRIVTHAL